MATKDTNIKIDGNYYGDILYAIQNEKGLLEEKVITIEAKHIDYIMGIYQDLYEQEALIYSSNFKLRVK